MELTVLFVVTVGAFAALLLYDIRAALFVAALFYGIYPRFFALGFGAEGFALTMQRAMLLLLLGMFVLRWLWRSPEIAQGWQVLSRHRVLLAAVLVYLLARLVGNIVSGRLDFGVAGQLVNESLISIFVLLLVTTYVRTRAQITLLLSLLMLSLLFNQLLSVYEYLAQEPVFPASLSLSYETGYRGDAAIAGRMRNETFRAMGVFDNPLKLAMFLGMLLPLVIYLATCAENQVVRLLARVSTLLALPTALFSGSRAALGVVGLIFVWYAYRAIIRRVAPATRKLAAVAGAIVGAVILALVADGLVNELLFGDAYANSTQARLMAYVTAPLLLVDSPLFGFGYARNIVNTLDVGALDPFYMLLALEGGLVALSAFIIFLIGSIRLLTPVSRHPVTTQDGQLAHALRLAIFVTMLLALVLTLSYVRMYLFLFAALAMVLLDLHRQERNPASAGDSGP